MIAPSELLQSEGVTGEFEVWNEDRWITIQKLGGATDLISESYYNSILEF